MYEPPLITRILDAERAFAAETTEATLRPWGWLFANPRIPESHDSNHAVITDLAALSDHARAADILAEIRRFYTSMRVSPRLYYLGLRGSGAGFRQSLADQGWSTHSATDRWFVRDRECTIAEVHPPEVRRVDAATAPLETIAQFDGAWSAREIEHSLRSCCRYHLLVGYVEDRPVSWASVQRLPDGLARVDDVFTIEPERRRGHCRQVMRALVGFHQQQLGGTLYLYAQDPVAIRVYEAAGFSCLGEGLEFWSAWRD